MQWNDGRPIGGFGTWRPISSLSSSPSSSHHPPSILPSSSHHPPIILLSSSHHLPIILPSFYSYGFKCVAINEQAQILPQHTEVSTIIVLLEFFQQSCCYKEAKFEIAQQRYIQRYIQRVQYLPSSSTRTYYLHHILNYLASETI
jgi:hypothetical protein